MQKGKKHGGIIKVAFDKCQQCGKWTSADCPACKERRRVDRHRQHARKASGAHEYQQLQEVEHQQFSLLNNQENDQASSNLHEDGKMSLSSGGQFYKAKYDQSGLPSSRVKTPRLLEPKGGNRPSH